MYHVYRVYKVGKHEHRAYGVANRQSVLAFVIMEALWSALSQWMHSGSIYLKESLVCLFI